MELNEMEYVNAQPMLPQLEKKILCDLRLIFFFYFSLRIKWGYSNNLMIFEVISF